MRYNGQRSTATLSGSQLFGYTVEFLANSGGVDVNYNFIIFLCGVPACSDTVA